MISHRSNRAPVISEAKSECAGCAAHKADLARLARQIKQNSRDISELKLRAGLNLDGNAPEDPPGNWVSIAWAAFASGYTESGIWAKVRRGALKRWTIEGRVVVDLGDLLHKNKKTSCVLSTAGAPTTGTNHLQESKGRYRCRPIR